VSRRILIAAVVAVIGACTSQTGQEPPGDAAPVITIPQLQLLGKVVDGNGDPVPEALVSVGGASTISAPDGWFDLATSAPGEVSVRRPAWTGSEFTWDGSSAFVELEIEPIKIRGLRVGGGVAGDDAKFAELLEIASDTAINALVFDTKQEGGRVLYETGVAQANESGAVVRAYDPRERIAQAKAEGLYLITRIVTFEDDYWAKASPEMAYEGGWINPTFVDGWEYPLELAEEACDMGFDEIQFDYLRFPSEAAAQSSGQLDMTETDRVDAIEAFVEAARARLQPLDCAMSADVFGIIVSAGNDQGIGQRPEELSRHLDAFSPMVYPSHYSPGWLGFDDPNDHPYDVTSGAIEDAQRRIEQGVVLRPWLQSFWWTDEEIRRSIQAAEDHDVGWLLWNAVSNFSRAAIPDDAELTG
jgi:hypothetical protein